MMSKDHAETSKEHKSRPSFFFSIIISLMRFEGRSLQNFKSLSHQAYIRYLDTNLGLQKSYESKGIVALFLLRSHLVLTCTR